MGVLNDRILFGYTTPGHRFLHMKARSFGLLVPTQLGMQHSKTLLYLHSFICLILHHSTISDRAMPRNESMDGLDTLLAEVRLAAAAQQQQLAIHLYYQQILGKTSTVLDSCKSLSSLHWRNDLHLGYLVCLTLLRIHPGILVRLWGEDEKRMIKLNLIATARELEL